MREEVMSETKPPQSSQPRSLMHWLLLSALLMSGLYAVYMVYSVGEGLIAGVLCSLLIVTTWVYASSRMMATRFVWPGVVAALIFVVVPMLYTMQMGFSNRSTRNLLDQARVRDYLLAQQYVLPNSEHEFSLHKSGTQYRLKLMSAEGQGYLSEALSLAADSSSKTAAPIPLQLIKSSDAAAEALPMPVSMRELIPLLPSLRGLRLATPSGLALSLNTLREFAAISPLYAVSEGEALRNQLTAVAYRPNAVTGFYESAQGEQLLPGFATGVGLQNYQRIFTDPKFSEPFLRIFLWTVLFSALSVIFAASLGMVIAVLLNWEALRYKNVYRLILFLPYAVPGFISILVFKGLFNQNLGEINLILNGLFGVKPAWFTDPFLAKVMLLMVNTWLGFPYMMLLCSGLIKAIPADLYEASAIAGARPITNFFRITLPLVLKPLTPLLIAAFAFNFNNFVLISLLTKGRPDYLDMSVPAGTTDLLVSYTWRIAFQESGQQFGLASAISTVIFLLVAAVTLVQMRLSRMADVEKR